MRRTACHILVSIVTFLLGVTFVPSDIDDMGIPKVQRGSRDISEIRFQRQGCPESSAECREYDVTFYSDGTARYFGYENSPDFIGSFHARPGKFRFVRLAQLIEKEGFFNLEAEYGTDSIDEKQTLTVVTNEGIKSVTTYNWSYTPPGLWTIMGMIDYEVFELCWEEG